MGVEASTTGGLEWGLRPLLLEVWSGGWRLYYWRPDGTND